MAKILQSTELPNSFTAPVTIPPLKINGFDKTLLKRVCKDAPPIVVSVLMYACCNLKDVPGNILNTDILMDATVIDMQTVINGLELSKRLWLLSIAYLVDHAILVKAPPYKSRLYHINPRFCNRFDKQTIRYYNEHMRNAFPQVNL